MPDVYFVSKNGGKLLKRNQDRCPRGHLYYSNHIEYEEYPIVFPLVISDYPCVMGYSTEERHGLLRSILGLTFEFKEWCISSLGYGIIKTHLAGSIFLHFKTETDFLMFKMRWYKN